MIKPDYKVPSMAEIEALPWNGYNVVSTFSGAGGSSLGYHMAGFKVLWASEFIPAAQEVYRLNFPDTILDTRDIRDVAPSDVLDATGLKVGELDLLDGSPPCAAFSTAGKREDGWGKVKDYSDTRQRVDDLFFEYARLLAGLQPKTFVAENVSGLVKGTAKGYFKEILSALSSAGYKVSARLLDSQWLGIPQARERLIFVGVRSDLGLRPAHPSPLPYRYTVKDVMPYITGLRLGGAPENWKSPNRPAGTVVQSDGYRKSDTGYMSSYQVSDKENSCRHWTIEELRLLTGLPADFQLTGDFGQQWERIGRMVPPIMMSHIAKAVQTKVLDKIGGSS